jgi:hypothetical protein
LAETLGLAQRLSGLRVADPERPGVTWRYTLAGGELRASRAEGDETKQSVLDYAFGSGRHAVTFVSLSGRDPGRITGTEHRLTYFAANQRLGVTPGQQAAEAGADETPMGVHLPASEVVHCFRCHTTMTSDDDGKTLDLATMIANVSCERCHGPGRGHVDAARRGERSLPMAFGPGRSTGREQMRLCGQCHRYPAFGGSGFDFEVPLSQIRPDNDKIVRFQPVGLMQSACYAKSQGALSCVSCHDPHDRSSEDPASYEETCLSCHQAPAANPPCPISPSADCLRCHMPARDSGQGIAFTDHWIRVRKAR